MENAIRFRDMILRGEIPLGTIVSFNDPAISEALCRDLDFIWIDAEHGAMLVVSADGEGEAERLGNQALLMGLDDGLIHQRSKGLAFPKRSLDLHSVE